jgi:hypothetical protein
MATPVILSRISGKVTTTTGGDNTFSAPSGNINLVSTVTNITNYTVIQGTGNVDNPLGFKYNPDDIYSSIEHRTGGALYVAGGVGIEKDLNVGGFIYGRISFATTSSQLVIKSTDLDAVFYPTFTDNPDAGGIIYADKTGTGGGLKYNPNKGLLTLEKLLAISTASSTSTTTGAIVVSGGVGIGENLYVSGAVVSSSLQPATDNKFAIGSTSTQWADAYIENIYTRVISSTTGTVQINPAAGVTEIIGDIRVLGQKPIGTAPVVTNILYVTMDGNDTNDGRAMDSSRACRTVTGAVNSEYYQPGTQIRVAPGRYLEDNPIALKPYTSIVGADLRTTSIEPINKTQDLFHLNSGCYLAQMQFLNGRSGLLEGPYDTRFNRGAYCTSFPPLKGDARINLFHSPYIQNCTNLSGPWLRDGTQFIPNQTVQIPSAVGIGSWDVNTATITLQVSSGDIQVGMSVNSGQQNPGFFNARTLLLANKQFMQEQVVAYVDASQLFPGTIYSREKFFRNIGILVENISYDAAFGGNEKAIESGLAYYKGVVSLIAGQELQTIAAIEYLEGLMQSIIVNAACTDLYSNGATSSAIYQQVINYVLIGGEISSPSLSNLTAIIINIIKNGITVAPTLYKSAGPDAAFVSAEILLNANRTLIQEDTSNWITTTFPLFEYNRAKCYRDIGLIIDAVSQDVLLGGNAKSIEAGLAYWSSGYNSITGQETTTTLAISYAAGLALSVIANSPATLQLTTTTKQIINPFFQYGGDYMPSQAVERNFNIIKTIIERGPLYAPISYVGSGLFGLTGINGADVKLAPTVISVTQESSGTTYIVTLDIPTVGFGNNATLYFGSTAVFPMQDEEFRALSLELTNNETTWDQRRVDPVGGMGGSLVDGAVISPISPIQSFVYDAFTQLTQGGRGIHITNDGYAQLVSVFTIFSSVGVQTDNGGIASIVNSNANFGDICLLAKGYGRRKFTGTIYNPANKAYPDNIELNEYYPQGFWPNNARIEVFLPDIVDRPHISLIMEIEPPAAHINEQALPGFLNAIPNKAVLTAGTIVIEDIVTDGIAVGNVLYIRDQFGSTKGNDGLLYADTNTIVTDVGYRSVTLSNALTSGGGDAENNNYFSLYFCGNSYYTVLSSEVATNPKEAGINLLSPAATGLAEDQVPAHIDSLNKLNSLINSIIQNEVVDNQVSDVSNKQVFLPTVFDGVLATGFIADRFNEIISIIGAVDYTTANSIVPLKSRNKSGTPSEGAGSAITLITANINFLAAEVSAYVAAANPNLVFRDDKCQRDTKIIVQRLLYDLETGGKYNSVMVGLSYWSRNGTHHIVQLGENVRRNDLFPDGSTVNFYQRSYMSASGYVFEYVGAGTNYGALPQVGRADPVQGKETVQLDSGKVFFTSTDQNGDFRIGPGLVISQATGVLSGRTFTKSLFANMTPFILAIEGGGV